MTVAREHVRLATWFRAGADHLREGWFRLRRLSWLTQLAAVVIGLVIAVTVFALVNIEPERFDVAPADVDTYNLLVNVAAELSVDFETAVTRLPAGLVTNLVTSQDERVTGVVALQAPSGTCLGFTVDVPLRLDAGSLERPVVGDVTEQPDSMCTP